MRHEQRRNTVVRGVYQPNLEGARVRFEDLFKQLALKLVVRLAPRGP